MNEINEGLNMEGSTVHGPEDNTAKKATCPKANYRLMQSLLKFQLPVFFLTEMNKLILKLIWKCKGP